MVVIVPPPPALPTEILSVHYVLDELLTQSPILVFYGPSATPTSTANNSRIQAHVFSLAGLQSYPRLTISPSSPLYSAVNCLPREQQGDDISRGLAFSVYKYFAELPQHIKSAWQAECSRVTNFPALTPFTDAHAALLASRMARVQNVADTIRDVRQALAEQSVSWLDVDVVLPHGSLQAIDKRGRDSAASILDGDQLLSLRYGKYATTVSLFGEPAFLPTSRLRRAPSRPTALNRSLNFSKNQKEAIRREMCEFLDTEENYVSKLHQLVHVIAADFREKAQVKAASSTSPSDAEVATLFPQSLDNILEVNSQFLEHLRKVVEDTENDAIGDIEASNETTLYSTSATPDLTGTVALSACLRNWFPKFSTNYMSYTKSHSQFSSLIKSFTNESQSSFSKRVHETGEQRLMSILIEPVQRLPRYNLYIDNIIKQLPARHPAIKPLLKARDIISEICSQDSVAAPPSKLLSNLQKALPSWPISIKPAGRLITAIDAIELSPPYRTDDIGQNSTYCVILVFTDYFIILGKQNKASLNARGLLSMIDSGDVHLNDKVMSELIFKSAYDLNASEFTEMDAGRLIQLFPISIPLASARPSYRKNSTDSKQVQVFYLSGSHEGKASRLLEDIAKARIEGRYPEAERESSKWEVRSALGNDLTLFVAFAEESIIPFEGRGVPSRIRICIDVDNFQSSTASVGVEVYASLSLVKNDLYQLDVSGPNEFSSRDTLTRVEFLPVLSKRCKLRQRASEIESLTKKSVTNIMQMKHQIKNSHLTETLLLRNQRILLSLKIITADIFDDSTKEKSRPASPVKMLANMFSGSIRESPRKCHSNQLSLSDIPQLSPIRRNSDNTSVMSGQSKITHAASTALERLEETLSTYVLALHARKGNIVGRSLQTRALAEESSINELYNNLLEDPENLQFAAQVSVDVLFASFEKFIEHAWKDKMGPIFTLTAWHSIHNKLDSYQLGEFEDTFRQVFHDMSPQNQRAIKSIIKLLVNLLEGTTNDGDQGILTMSFAEVLVPDGNIHDFVPFLDRLVEDMDLLLLQRAYTGHGLASNENSTKSAYHGSITSASSSLRKKFGLLSRMGSKSQANENESEGSSVWRTLSKSKQGSESQPSSLSRATGHNRSNSAVTEVANPHKRPSSRDKNTQGSTLNDHPRPLSTIGEGHSPERPRKKRRSSLSDLTALNNSAPATPAFLTPKTPPRLSPSPIMAESPRTPSLKKVSLIPHPSPKYNSGNSRGSLSYQRENEALATIPRAVSPPKLTYFAPTDDEHVTINTHHGSSPRQRNTNNSSVIPIYKQGGLTERPTSGNARKLPPPPILSEKPEKANALEGIPTLNPLNGKLRMQSPQKIKERLIIEQGHLSNAQRSIDSDYIKLSEALANINGPQVAGFQGHQSAKITSTQPVSTSQTVRALESQLGTTATKHATLFTALRTRLDTLSRDLEESLLVSEQKGRGLDELYREANAENEALYSRFNEELARIMNVVRVGEGNREVLRRAKDVEEENIKLRKENGRLRREIVGLRAQLKE